MTVVADASADDYAVDDNDNGNTDDHDGDGELNSMHTVDNTVMHNYRRPI